MMRKIVMVSIAIMFAVSLLACAAKNQKKVEQEMKEPINCATAEGDIRVLQHEKTHVGEQIAAGVTALVPAGFVLGAATGTEGTKMKVASGEYNQMIDDRIAAIKAKCGIQ